MLPISLYHTDQFVLPLPEGHRFPMVRYRLLRERLVSSGLVDPDWIRIPPAAREMELIRVHCPRYVHRVFHGGLSEEELRRIGFPWTPEMVERSRRSVGATITAARDALTELAGVNLAGGTHHAFVDRGGGYCVFNDVAVAIRAMQADGRIQRALVIDCDVHQGDGTAAIFAEDPAVFTFSIHAAKAYPARKQVSSLDVPLPPGTGDGEYLAQLAAALNHCLGRGPFDLAFYLAGADPFVGDRLGGLALSKTGLQHRDRLVFQCCRQSGIPIVVTMAGGYAYDVNDIVDIQSATVQSLLEIYGEIAPASGEACHRAG